MEHQAAPRNGIKNGRSWGDKRKQLAREPSINQRGRRHSHITKGMMKCSNVGGHGVAHRAAPATEIAENIFCTDPQFVYDYRLIY